MLKKRSRNLGKFNQESSSFVLSDPSFNKKGHRQTFPLNARVSSVEHGLWKACVLYDAKSSVVSELIIHRDDLRRSEAEWLLQKKLLPVDTGMIGIFDLKHYSANEEDVRHELHENDAIIYRNSGAVCRPGFGNGFYRYYTWKLDGKAVVGVRLTFITPEYRAQYERMSCQNT